MHKKIEQKKEAKPVSGRSPVRGAFLLTCYDVSSSSAYTSVGLSSLSPMRVSSVSSLLMHGIPFPPCTLSAHASGFLPPSPVLHSLFALSPWLLPCCSLYLLPGVLALCLKHLWGGGSLMCQLATLATEGQAVLSWGRLLNGPPASSF